MNQGLEIYNDYTKKCFKEDPPPCRCLCPFKLDVRSFTGKIARGKFDSAYREYRNAVLFPEIVSRICTAPCEAVCVRGDTQISFAKGGDTQKGGGTQIPTEPPDCSRQGTDRRAALPILEPLPVSLRGIEAACIA
ncbi:MAG: hypothetical protein FWG03_07085, partial [Clostridiales bacterium]|nr:hypothetical protein [Clostridiales bacterium]